MREHLNKIEKFISSIGEYGQVSTKMGNVRRVDFNSIISEVLNENKLVTRYPQVRYQFNLLKSRTIVSDYKKVKSIVRQLMVNAFQAAATSANPQVLLSIESDENESLIQVSNSGELIENNVKSNIFNFFYRANSQSEKIGAGLSLIKESLQNLKGKMLLSSSANNNTLNIIIPDLETQNIEKFILPYTSAALRVV